jgi:hypothetical protein
VFGIGGDSFCAAFSTAADAAAAAIESQEQLRDEVVVKFAVRMALHTGEAVERVRNYFGTEVTRAAALTRSRSSHAVGCVCWPVGPASIPAGSAGARPCVRARVPLLGPHPSMCSDNVWT